MAERNHVLSAASRAGFFRGLLALRKLGFRRERRWLYEEGFRALWVKG
jgi:hypothetical protein